MSWFFGSFNLQDPNPKITDMLLNDQFTKTTVIDNAMQTKPINKNGYEKVVQSGGANPESSSRFEGHYKLDSDSGGGSSEMKKVATPALAVTGGPPNETYSQTFTSLNVYALTI